MSLIATLDPSRHVPIRAAVLELLAQAAPRPAALGAPSPEEQEFLETLRRIVRRSNAEELWDKYYGSRPDARGAIVARYDD
jgi:hypothetical protein